MRTFSWGQSLGLDPRRPVSAPLYGRYCYSIQTLPAPRNRLCQFNSRLDLAKLAYVLPNSRDQPRGALESGCVFISKSSDGSEHKETDGSTESIPKESETGSEVISESHTTSQDQVNRSSDMTRRLLTCMIHTSIETRNQCLTTFIGIRIQTSL